MHHRHVDYRSRRARLAVIVLISATIGLLLALVWTNLAWRAVVNQGLTALDDSSRVEIYRSGWLQGMLLVGVVGFVLVCWSVFYRAMLLLEKQLLEYQGKLRQLGGELEHANHVLQLRAKELAHAHADLAESNLHLSTEIQARIHAEAVQEAMQGKLLAANKASDRESEFDLKLLMKDVLKTLGGSMKENGVELVREWHDVPPVYSDRHKVMQILANLVTNAIHALLSASHHSRRLTVRLNRGGENRVFVEVEDNGVGIDPTLLTKVFQYGFTTKQTGHGFGLHHSALVARELGGELRVHSKGPGRGARFTLELPITRDVESVEPELIGV